jgi:hypothetical protein
MRGQNLDRVGTQVAPGTAGAGDLGQHLLTRQGMTHEHDATPMAGHAVPAMSHGAHAQHHTLPRRQAGSTIPRRQAGSTPPRR